MTESTKISQDILKCEKDGMCRGCMARKKNMKCLFSSRESCIVERLEYCTGIHVTKSDGLPTKLCGACLSTLAIAYKFKTDCLRTDKMLRTIFKQYELKVEIKQESNEVEQDGDDIKDDYFKQEVDCDFDNDNICYRDDDEVDDDDRDCDTKLNNLVSKNQIDKKNTQNTIANIPTAVSVKILKINKNKGTVKKKLGKAKTKTTKNTQRIPKKKHKDIANEVDVTEERQNEIGERKKSLSELRLFCNKCNLQFTNKKQICEHKRDVHGYEMICEICGKQFLYRSAHYSHMRLHYSPALKCDLCDYSTSINKDLEKHMRIHNNIKEYSCEYCTRTFFTTSNLHFHINHRHLGNVVKNHACPRCDYRTYSKDKLRRHLDAHDNIKRYECELCGSKYARREQWKKHMENTHQIMVPRLRPGRTRTVLNVNAIKPTSQYTEISPNSNEMKVT